MEYTGARDDPRWDDNKYEYSSSELKGNFFYNLEFFEFTDNHTIFHFKISPSKMAKIQNTSSADNTQDIEKGSQISKDANANSDPFPDPVIKKVLYGYDDNVYPLLHKKVQVDSAQIMIVDLYFPLISRGPGEIVLWTDFSNQTEYERLFVLASPSLPDGVKGTPIWGLLFCCGLLIFVIGLNANPTRQLRKQLLRDIDKIDDKKDYFLRNISRYSSYDNLSSKDKYRYDSAISCFEQAQSLIFDFYRDFSLRTSSSFENLYRAILLCGLVILVFILVYTVLSPLLPDLFEIGTHHLWESNYPESNVIEARLNSLEAAKSSLSVLLSSVLLFGVVSIGLNYALGIWRVRQVARSEMATSIMGYDKELTEQINSKTELLEDKFSTVEKSLEIIEKLLDKNISDLTTFANLLKKDFDKIFQNSIKAVKKDSKKSTRRIKKDFKCLLKD
jgi:hypothetical protein